MSQILGYWYIIHVRILAAVMEEVLIEIKLPSFVMNTQVKDITFLSRNLESIYRVQISTDILI